METVDLLETVETETGPDPRWSIVWLHGLGADGHDFAPIVPELVRSGWPSLRFVFPHAPVRAVAINAGMRMRAWYDIPADAGGGIDLASRADSEGVEASITQVGALLDREHARGIPAARTFLAGFSQGGAITLAAGLRRHEPLAGLVALSTYLPMTEARAAETLRPEATAQPVFMAHGSADPVIPVQGAQWSAAVLQRLGFALEWHAYPMPHSVCAEEIQALGDWLQRRFESA